MVNENLKPCSNVQMKGADVDEIGESMEMEFSEAKQILNESGYQLIDEALEGPATSKQLWTLFKLTKKDYRGQDLSKEDAFKMIGELLKNKENGSTENEETPVKKEPKSVKPKINDNPLVKVGDIFSFSFGSKNFPMTRFPITPKPWVTK